MLPEESYVVSIETEDTDMTYNLARLILRNWNRCPTRLILRARAFLSQGVR